MQMKVSLLVQNRYRIHIGAYILFRTLRSKTEKIFERKKKMKKTLALILSLAMVFALCACGGSAPAAQQQDPAPQSETSDSGAVAAEPVVIRCGTLNQQLSIPLYYIQQQGWDVENGFKLELSTFAQGSGINEALGAGLIDVFTIGAAGINSCCVYDAVYLYSHENSGAGQQFMVRADSAIAQEKGNLADFPEVLGSAETIKGTEFLLPMATTAQILADVYLQQFGLTEDDVTLINMSDDATCYQAFVSGEADFAKTSYPTADQYTEDYVVAASMANLSVPFWDNVLVSRDFYTNNRDALVKLVVQMIRAAEAFQDQQLLIDTMMAWYDECGVTVDPDVITHQVLERPFFTAKELAEIDRLSSFALIIDFYAQVEIITADQHEKVKANMDDSVIVEALEAYNAEYGA